MSSNNLGRAVKWQDPEDGGWHTGREVLPPGFPKYGSHVDDICAHDAFPQGRRRRLIQESCDGKLTWVDTYLLLDWQPRSEWEDNDRPIPFSVDHPYVAQMLGLP